MKVTEADILAIKEEIDGMKKYRELSLPMETIADLANANGQNCKNLKELKKVVREKLHAIIAPYLGDPDYAAITAEFDALDKNDMAALEEFCRRQLEIHVSTRERCPDLAGVYRYVFEHTGLPSSVADFACGIQPIALPFMGLKKGSVYRAYDINGPRVEFLNHFILSLGYGGGAFSRDILADTPTEHTDVALFFKEAHRFENRRKGCVEGFIERMNADVVVVSLPATNVDKQHTLSAHYYGTIENAAEKHGWQIEKGEYLGEVFYFIRK